MLFGAALLALAAPAFVLGFLQLAAVLLSVRFDRLLVGDVLRLRTDEGAECSVDRACPELTFVAGGRAGISRYSPSP